MKLTHVPHLLRTTALATLSASLILTDELIDAARAAGTLPPQPDEDDLGDLEIDETDEDTDTNEETGDVT